MRRWSSPIVDDCSPMPSYDGCWINHLLRSDRGQIAPKTAETAKTVKSWPYGRRGRPSASVVIVEPLMIKIPSIRPQMLPSPQVAIVTRICRTPMVV